MGVMSAALAKLYQRYGLIHIIFNPLDAMGICLNKQNKVLASSIITHIHMDL